MLCCIIFLCADTINTDKTTLLTKTEYACSDFKKVREMNVDQFLSRADGKRYYASENGNRIAFM